MNQLYIRTASEEDIQLIRSLALEIWPQTYTATLGKAQVDYMLELMYSEASITEQMKTGKPFILVYNGNAPVGFASYGLTEPGIYKLHKIYILPNQQGKGTGRFVIDYITDDIKNKNGAALQLQVNKFNKAKSFYEKLGFTVIKDIVIDIGNGYVMDDYLMEKKL